MMSEDKVLTLTKFVVGGSKIEEFLELIKLKKDIDPVFPVSVIERATPGRIKLNIEKDKLKSTYLDEDAIEVNEYKLTSLRKIPVFDNSNEKIGRVVDLKFDGNSFQLILGDSVVTEWAESVGLTHDVDFLIAPSFINEFEKDKITLTENKVDLKSTFIVNLTEYQSNAETKAAADNLKAKAVYFPSVMYY